MKKITPDRRQQVEALYHAALERAAEARADFLRAACGGDEELYHEVQSLLSFELAGNGLQGARS